jgi:hypothetical protein
MMADTKGTLSSISDTCPLLNFVKGVFNDTLLGTQSLVVKPGINRYSLKVLDVSFKY